MPARKRKRREPTHDWQEIQQATLWPEQEAYERLRLLSFLGRPPPSGPKKRELVNARCTIKLSGLSKKAWRACFPSSPVNR
jgi:hypothetical protein